MIRRVMILFLLALAACAPAEQSSPPPVSQTQVEERARSALEPLKRRLMGELTGALGQGPVHALEACNLRAQEIPAELSEGGVEVGRTSHRLRNPANAPEAWMEPILAAYLVDPSHRGPKTIRIDDQTMGYAEPITVQAMCLACHGTEVDEKVKEKLAELYPDDQATGFEAGEFRGMFWVKLPAKVLGE